MSDCWLDPASSVYLQPPPSLSFILTHELIDPPADGFLRIWSQTKLPVTGGSPEKETLEGILGGLGLKDPGMRENGILGKRTITQGGNHDYAPLQGTRQERLALSESGFEETMLTGGSGPNPATNHHTAPMQDRGWNPGPCVCVLSKHPTN